MDSGASGYHICSLMVNNDRMRGIYHEQRDFYQASPAASVQSTSNQNQLSIFQILLIFL